MKFIEIEESELADLREDKARLDWMEANVYFDNRIIWPKQDDLNLRQRVDNARNPEYATKPEALFFGPAGHTARKPQTPEFQTHSPAEVPAGSDPQQAAASNGVPSTTITSGAEATSSAAWERSTLRSPEAHR